MEFLEHGRKNLSSTSKSCVKFGANVSICGIQKNLKSKTKSTDSNVRLPCESSGRTKDLPTVTPRFEARSETRNPQRAGRGVWVSEILRL
ncbi:hypothetical protein AVEN_201833-1 [Araneus ventricosus]|uniref:Uncharacterized protein n=1 Tax=Araneus ventricosus TaxID=182803 RepID=A0A4Y2PZJ6_ARAVE|nr:hypothetical protein AVEN_113829-1 [Araneus ventricosus]GBN55529.1 hypothetical protein AVEN_201833-1 [Araneus ventricosus]